MEGLRKRLPGVERKISEIQPESDVRVKILGTVIDVNNESVVVDDGSGKIEIVFDTQPTYLEQGQLIRIITRVLPTIDGFECRGECIQLLTDFDIELYKKTNKIIKGD